MIELLAIQNNHLQKNERNEDVLVADSGDQKANFELVIDDDAEVLFGADLVFEDGRGCQDFGLRTHHEVDRRPLLHLIRKLRHHLNLLRH